MVITDLFPSKFSGTEAESRVVEIWADRFKTAAAVNKLDEATAMSYFKLWTEDEWLKKLIEKFGKVEFKGSIFELIKFNKDKDESMDVFNKKFAKYVPTIPKELIKKVYLEIISGIDHNVWWQCTQLDKDLELDKVMEDAVKLMNVKDQLKPPAAEKKDPTPAESSSREEIQSVVDELAREMENLVLLSKNPAPRKDYSEVTCYNCQKKGHTSRICQQAIGQGNQKKPDDKDKKILIAVKDLDSKITAMGEHINKRPRFENILNRGKEVRVIEANVPRLGKINKKKKKTNNSRIEPENEWSKRVLDSQAPISIKEVLALKPKLVKDLVKSLQYVGKSRKRNILYAEESESESEESDSENDDAESEGEGEEESLSYLCTYINSEPIPLFIDPGAAYSIISSNLLKKLNFLTTKLKNPIRIKPVSGDTILVRHSVDIPIEFDDSTMVVINFIVVENCAVPILLGLNSCQRLKSKIDYESETFTIRNKKKKYIYQLYSKESLAQEFADNREDEIVQSSVPLFYASIEAEIADTSYLGVGDFGAKNTESKDAIIGRIYEGLEEKEFKKMESLIYSYSELFAKNIGDITGIKNSDYVLRVDNNVSPLASKLRRPDPVKVDALSNLVAPKNVSGVRSMIGLFSYFRRFIPHFSEEIEPIQALVKKNNTFSWDNQCQRSFERVAKILVETPRLTQPDFNKPFILSTDASSFAIGALLEQMNEDGKLTPISYYSKKMSVHEKNYSAFEKESLALVSAIKHFRCYLWNVKFTVFTDNSAVSRLHNMADVTGRVSRWISYLSEYDFTLYHRAGKLNQVADFLSRPVYFAANEEKSTNDKPMEEVTWENILEFLAGKTDEVNAKVRKQSKRYMLFENELFRRTKTGVLKVITQMSELHVLLNKLHNEMGHFSHETIYGFIKGKYWRPRLSTEVKEFCRSCYECQMFVLRRPRYKFDGRSQISGIFSSVQIDFLGPLPESESGKRYVFVCVERLTGYPWLFAVADQTATTTRDCLKELVSMIGPPESINCDNAQGFRSVIIQNFCKDNKIKLEFNIPHQPEWMGSVERMNSTVRYALAKACLRGYADWEKKLPDIAQGIRMHTSSRTGYSPYFLLFGIEARMPDEYGKIKTSNLALRYIEIETLPGKRENLKREARHSTQIPIFEVGDYVLALNHRLRKRNPSAKTIPRYEGPYLVREKEPHNVYVVESEDKNMKSFHVSRLIKFFGRHGVGK
ncbi:Transposon Tf2-11 polyprotein [Smittium culicis]|uniref:RNA-directed DNA polymerase n=1 Tax=Smittium culicis TaxID=133412 RepID=A0A1R1Y2Q6_9FUNG|nr:Transposon Tf2-11 polyprotein [Smittium culicis]